MAVAKNCHIAAFVGGKGGVGKSLLAANLALAASRELRLSTLLMDLDQQSCGDQNIILGLRSKYNVRKLSQHKGAFNQQTLKSLLASHPSGLSYLAAVSGPEERLLCDLTLFKKQLFNLSGFFRLIFVDLGSEMNPLQQSVLDSASAVMVVTVSEILALNQTKRLLAGLSHLPSSLFHLIINKDGRRGLSPSAAAAALRLSLLAQFPDDEAVDESLHASKPMVISSPQSAFSKTAHDVIRKLNGGILQRGKQLGPKRSEKAFPSVQRKPHRRRGARRPGRFRKRGKNAGSFDAFEDANPCGADQRDGSQKRSDKSAG